MIKLNKKLFNTAAGLYGYFCGLNLVGGVLLLIGGDILGGLIPVCSGFVFLFLSVFDEIYYKKTQKGGLRGIILIIINLVLSIDILLENVLAYPEPLIIGLCSSTVGLSAIFAALAITFYVLDRPYYKIFIYISCGASGILYLYTFISLILVFNVGIITAILAYVGLVAANIITIIAYATSYKGISAPTKIKKSSIKLNEEDRNLLLSNLSNPDYVPAAIDIQRYRVLLDEGLITSEDFASIRQKYLDKIK